MVPFDTEICRLKSYIKMLALKFYVSAKTSRIGISEDLVQTRILSTQGIQDPYISYDSSKACSGVSFTSRTLFLKVKPHDLP